MRIYGADSDLIEVEGHHRADEYNYERLRFTIGDKAGGVVVIMEYGNARVTAEGCWHATICQIAEDVPIPWPTSIEVASNTYSVEVRIGCPQDTPVRIEEYDGKRWVQIAADLRKQALAKLTPEEIAALGIEP